MATPPDSPIEEEVVLFELEPSARTPKPIPVALEDLCRLTKFTRQEIRVMYRGFKTVANISLLHFFQINLKTKYLQKKIRILYWQLAAYSFQQ